MNFQASYLVRPSGVKEIITICEGFLEPWELSHARKAVERKTESKSGKQSKAVVRGRRNKGTSRSRKVPSKRETQVSAELYSQLAKKVVNDSLRLKQGETVTVETWNNGIPFARQVVIEARRIGAIPLMIVEDEEAYLDGVKNMPKEVLGKMGQHEYNLISGTNAYVFIPGPPIAAYAPMITKEENVAATSYNSSWYEAAENAKLRGARLTFGYVGKDLAKLLGKKEEDIISHQIRAALVDYDALKARGRQIAEDLVDGASVVLSSEGGGNSLKLTLKGDLSVEDGIIDEQDIIEGNNMGYLHPGMVAKGIDSSSVNGAVSISPSQSRVGIVSEARLHFEGGRLTRWESKDKETKEKLDALIGALPEENRLIRSLTIGFNPEVKYGYSHDRFVPGAISITGFGFTAIVRDGDLVVNGKKLVEAGTLRVAEQ